MIQVVCDACSAPIAEQGYVCDIVETRLVYSTEGPPRMSDRGEIRSMFVCDACRRRVERALNIPQRRAG